MTHVRILLPLFSFLLVACSAVQLPMQQTQPAQQGGASSGPAVEGNAPTSTGSALVTERVLPTGGMELGAENAPITMMLFTNPYCRYCKDFQEEIIPRLMAEYVQQGVVRITILPFVLQKYENSTQASLLYLCAARQDRGYDMHELLFREQLRTTAFTTALTAMGLNQQQLEACTASDGARTTIDALQSIARSLDVTVVPTYFINGTKFVGLPEYADIRGQIESGI